MTPDAPHDLLDELEAVESDICILRELNAAPEETIAAMEETAEEIRAEIAAQENLPSPTE